MSKPVPYPPLTAGPLHTRTVGARVVIFDTVSSTSTRVLEEDLDGAVVVAEKQTLGRGRHGRRWQSAPGLGLWFSVRLDDMPEGLSIGAAVAVRDALRPWCELRMKWPNDLLLNGRKVCGILVEQRDGATALGIGVNLRHRPEDFSPDLRATATSVEWETRRACDRDEVFTALLHALDVQVARLRGGDYEAVRREWVEACDIKGRRVRSADVVGTVVDIDLRGGLVLETEQGERKLHCAGDIHVLESA